jgi:cytochrome bd-type quinol oxidase subunit 2
MPVIATILLTTHLLAMNVASAGPLVCLWLRVRSGHGDNAAHLAGKQLAQWAVIALALGVLTGISLGALGWFNPEQGFADAIRRFPTSAVANFVGEILFAFVCLGVYAGTWERWQHQPWPHGLFAVLAATNMLYHFPPLMAVISELSSRPEMVAEPVITRTVFRPLMLRPEVLSQSAHFVIASFAVSGAALIVIAWRQRRRQVEDASPLISFGAWIALIASLAQLAVGVWVLFELPQNMRGSLMGDAGPATALFIAAILVTLGLLHTLSTLAFGDTNDANVRRGIVLMIGLVLLMTAILRTARTTEQFSAAYQHQSSPQLATD